MMALRRLGTPMARSRVLTPAVWPGLPTEPALSRLGGDAYLSATASTPSSIRPLCSSSSTGSSWWSKLKNADAKTKAVTSVAVGISALIIGSAFVVSNHVEKKSKVVIIKKIKKERKKRMEFQRHAVQGHNEFALKTDERYNNLQGQFNELQLKCNLHHEKELSFWNQIDIAFSTIRSQAGKVEELLANSGSNPLTECHQSLHEKSAELKSEIDRLQLLVPKPAAKISSGKEACDAGGSASESSLKADGSNSEEVPSKLTAMSQTLKDEDSPPGPKPPKKKTLKADESSSQELVPSKKTEAHQTVEENAPDPKPPKI